MVTLVIEDMEKLPRYSPEMPITIKHFPSAIQHMVEKTVTLNVGKSHSSHEGSATALFMTLKPDKETGTHNLPLRGYVMQTAVSPDTSKIPAELFFYMEKIAEWEEKV